MTHQKHYTITNSENNETSRNELINAISGVNKFILFFYFKSFTYPPKLQREIFIYLKSYIKIMQDCIKSTVKFKPFLKTLYLPSLSKNTLQTRIQ